MDIGDQPMRMYHFRYKGYGESVTVCAWNEEAARGCLKFAHSIEKDKYAKSILQDMLDGKDYTVEVYDPGDLLWTERS